MLDELALSAEIAQEVLPEHELAVFKMREPDQEHVRARPTSEPGGLRIQEKDVLPSGRRFALEAQVSEEQRVARSPSDDLQPEVVDREPLLEYFVRQWRARAGGRARPDGRAGRRSSPRAFRPPAPAPPLSVLRGRRRPPAG